jgi:hypothetical protein
VALVAMAESEETVDQWLSVLQELRVVLVVLVAHHMPAESWVGMESWVQLSAQQTIPVQ